MTGSVFLIPTVLHEEAPGTIPPYVLESVKQCQAFFVENERTTRRFLKSIWREMVIDEYEWFTIHKAEEQVQHVLAVLGVLVLVQRERAARVRVARDLPYLE